MTSCANCDHSLVSPHLATSGITLNNCPNCGWGRVEKIRRNRELRQRNVR